MHLELAEAAGEGHVLGRGEGLVTEEQDLELVERGAELGHHPVLERAAQVEALHHGADGGPLPADVEVVEAQLAQPGTLGREVGHRSHLHAPGLDGDPPGRQAGRRVA